MATGREDVMMKKVGPLLADDDEIGHVRADEPSVGYRLLAGLTSALERAANPRLEVRRGVTDPAPGGYDDEDFLLVVHFDDDPAAGGRALQGMMGIYAHRANSGRVSLSAARARAAGLVDLRIYTRKPDDESPLTQPCDPMRPSTRFHGDLPRPRREVRFWRGERLEVPILTIGDEAMRLAQRIIERALLAAALEEGASQLMVIGLP